MSEAIALPPEGFVVLGYVARPHGVHGAVVIIPYTEEPQFILEQSCGLELLSPDSLSRQPVVSLKGKLAAQGLIVKLKNVTSRDAASELRGWRIGLSRELMPKIEDDEVYLSDLSGLSVMTPDGRNLGRVKGHLEAGGALLLAVLAPEGEGREILIPFNNEFVLEVDLKAGRLLVDPPEGLLDL